MFDWPARRKSCSSFGDAVLVVALGRPEEQATVRSVRNATAIRLNGRGRQQIRDLRDSG
jgi:hypothetical protein